MERQTENKMQSVPPPGELDQTLSDIRLMLTPGKMDETYASLILVHYGKT